MQNDDIKQSVADYLGSHQKMTLATVTPEGNPLAHTVDYVAEGTTLYFGTSAKSRKTRDIKNNPNVAYAVDEDYADFMKIQGVQMEAIATIITDETELGRIYELFVKRFPAVADMPRSEDTIIVKVTPVGGFFLDYLKGFGHTDRVTF